MKKFLAYFASFMIVAVLALTVMSFTDGDPKKHKCENTAAASDTTKTCAKHADGGVKKHQCENTASASDTTKTCAKHADANAKKCCKEEGKTASAECKKSETCKHHQNTADAAAAEKK